MASKEDNGMTQDGNHIIADEGKVFRRIVSGEDYGGEIYLGYSHYIGGVLQDPPHLDIPEDFEEVYPEVELTDSEALQIILGNE